jgi:hypothetical protein
VQLQDCAYHWIQDHSNYHVEILVVDVLDLEGQKDVHVQVDLHAPWADLAFEVLDQEAACLEVASLVSYPEVAPSSFLVDGHVDVDVDFEDLDLEVALVEFLTALQTENSTTANDYTLMQKYNSDS